MRRLLRNVNTGQYFLNGKWTSNAAEAHGFRSTMEAIEVAIKYHLPEVEVVLQFGPQPSDVYDCHLALGFSRGKMPTEAACRGPESPGWTEFHPSGRSGLPPAEPQGGPGIYCQACRES